MEAILHQLFPEQNSSIITTLAKDDSPRALYREAAKRLMKSGILLYPKEQFILITHLANFASSEDECFDVANILYWGIRRKNIRPMMSEHEGVDFAYRALVSLSLFKKMLIAKHERYAAPHPSYIRKHGITSFKSVGMRDIAEHFEQWELLINEQLAI